MAHYEEKHSVAQHARQWMAAMPSVDVAVVHATKWVLAGAPQWPQEIAHLSQDIFGVDDS